MMSEIARLVMGEQPLGQISRGTIDRMVDMLVRQQVMDKRISSDEVFIHRFLPPQDEGDKGE